MFSRIANMQTRTWRVLAACFVAGVACSVLSVACAGKKQTQPQTSNHTAIAPKPAQRSDFSTAKLQLLASSTFDHRAEVHNTRVGGLSAITFDAKRGQFYVLSDDRSAKAPARFYTMQWQPNNTSNRPEITHVTTLLAADGKPFPSAVDNTRPNIPVIDPEAMRYHPQRETLFWTSEGDVRRGLPPFVAESSVDGKWLRAFALPPVLVDAFEQKQMRNNATFEGLALSRDGKTLWVGMEGALKHDSDEPTTNAGALLRFTAFDVESGKASKQVLYRTDPLPFIPLGYASMGVTELDFDPQGNLLVLERAYMAGVGVSVRLYRVLANDLAVADDVLQVSDLPAKPSVLSKTLVTNFNTSGLQPLDNMEAMCQWQPANGEGDYMLFATDNNFNPMQVTQVSSFQWVAR